MKYGTGIIFSPDHARGLGAPLHLAAGAVPDRAYIELPEALDQGRTSSCTGNAAAVALQTEMRTEAFARNADLRLRAGQYPDHHRALLLRIPAPPHIVWPELPSRSFLYGIARIEGGNFLTDDGASLSNLFDAASQVGFPRESAWPFDPKKLTTRPPWDVYQAAADQKLSIGLQGAYRLSGSIDEVKRAIAAGSVIVWGSELDQAFEDLKAGETWPGVRGEPVGGHAMVLHAYEPYAGGTRLASRSSWTADFADNGSAWVDSRAVSMAKELWAIALAPVYSEAA